MRQTADTYDLRLIIGAQAVTRSTRSHVVSGHAQKAVLLVVWACEGELLPLSWISEHSGCTAAVAWRALLVLEGLGWIRRSPKNKHRLRYYTLNRHAIAAASIFTPPVRRGGFDALEAAG